MTAILKLTIEKITDVESYPGWCVAYFLDSDSNKIEVEDKIPVLFDGELDLLVERLKFGKVETSIPCEVKEKKDGLFMIDISTKRDFEDTNGNHLFWVNKESFIRRSKQQS